MIKPLVFLMLSAIVASLFSGLYFVYRDRGTGDRAVWALTLRIGLSLVLFIMLMLAFRFGLLPA